MLHAYYLHNLDDVYVRVKYNYPASSARRVNYHIIDHMSYRIAVALP